MHPYEMMYRGELAEETEPSEDEWDKSEYMQVSSRYLILPMLSDINSMKNALEWDEETAHVARGHSKEMYEEDYFSHDSPTLGDLTQRLGTKGCAF